MSSAGLFALVGHRTDPVMLDVAKSRGLHLDNHRAAQFMRDDAAEFDLILVMENAQRLEIARRAPELTGRTMLFSHWLGDGEDIVDPFSRPRAVHEKTFDHIALAADAWIQKL